MRPGPPAGLHQRPEQKLMTAWRRALAAETENVAFWRVNQQVVLRVSEGGGLQDDLQGLDLSSRVGGRVTGCHP